MKIAIVASNFNEEITNNLIDGALRCYKDYYNKNLNLEFVYKVPGAFEIPSFVNYLLLLDNINFDAVVTLGCVIKGETAHFEYIFNSLEIIYWISFCTRILNSILTSKPNIIKIIPKYVFNVRSKKQFYI